MADKVDPQSRSKNFLGQDDGSRLADDVATFQHERDEVTSSTPTSLLGFLTKDGRIQLSDQRLLELVLTSPGQRANAVEISKLLMSCFGDFNSALSARRSRLKAVLEDNSEAIFQLKLIEAAARRFSKSRIEKKQVVSDWSAIIDYCIISMAYLEVEQFRVFFIDRRNVLICDEVQAVGTTEFVSVYPREVMRRALELKAASIVLVHNHPSGDPTPSESDIRMTKELLFAAESVGLSIQDHLIIGRSGVFSFRMEELI